jgi:hypothetical protein
MTTLARGRTRTVVRYQPVPQSRGLDAVGVLDLGADLVEHHLDTHPGVQLVGLDRLVVELEPRPGSELLVDLRQTGHTTMLTASQGDVRLASAVLLFATSPQPAAEELSKDPRVCAFKTAFKPRRWGTDWLLTGNLLPWIQATGHSSAVTAGGHDCRFECLDGLRVCSCPDESCEVEVVSAVSRFSRRQVWVHSEVRCAEERLLVCRMAWLRGTRLS